MKAMKPWMAAAAIVTLTGAAQAAPISLSASIFGFSTLGPGAHFGTFDGWGQLPANFVINSARFSFAFSDDFDLPTTDTSVRTEYTNYELVRRTTNPTVTLLDFERSAKQYSQVSRTGQREGVSVSLAGVGVGSGATAESSSNSSTPLSYDGKFFVLVK